MSEFSVSSLVSSSPSLMSLSYDVSELLIVRLIYESTSESDQLAESVSKLLSVVVPGNSDSINLTCLVLIVPSPFSIR